MTAPLSNADIMSLLMASPLYQKLEQIKQTLSSGTLAGHNHLKDGMLSFIVLSFRIRVIVFSLWLF